MKRFLLAAAICLICLPKGMAQNVAELLSPDSSRTRGSQETAAATDEESASLAEALSGYRAPAFPLTHFAVEPVASQHQIVWTQATPRQAFRVYVQRSFDGQSWHEIAAMVGEPTRKPLQDWSYLDPRPEPGPNFYRLRQVTADGRSVLSEVVVAEACPGGSHLTSLFPHPGIFGTRIHLQLDSPQAVTVRLLDSNRTLLKDIFQETAFQGNHDVDVDLTDLPGGLYLCEIEVGGQVATRSIRR